MKGRIRAVQFGCGPIGCAVAGLTLQRPNIELVGAVDVDPNKIGRDLGEVMGLGKNLGIPITEDIDGLFARTRVDIVFHQTSSFLKKVAPELIHLLGFGVNIVSTTEEWPFPSPPMPS